MVPGEGEPTNERMGSHPTGKEFFSIGEGQSMPASNSA